jgi:ABC-type nickel/cobalt efflux system permease component RcnA
LNTVVLVLLSAAALTGAGLWYVVDRHRDEILRLRNTSDFQIAQCDDSEVDSDAHAHCDGEDCDEVHWVGNDSDGDAEHDHDDFDGDEEEFDGDEGDFDDEDVDSDD